MPPKPPKPARGKAEEGKEEPLQAVVIADTFETKFAPLSLTRPRCLLPLANVPVIEYTLEFLASNGVQEIFFYGGAHIDQIEEYLNHSKWLSNTSPFSKFLFLRCMATSVGDVMRDLDQKHLIAGDFICVSGDVISDFGIVKALKEHKLRREKDKNAIMTMLLRVRAESNYQNSQHVVPTFVIDPIKNRCLHYEENTEGANFGVHIDPELLKAAELDIRQDLVDCRIDICTPDVLSLWSDNFDNQRPRKDFLFGVLKDYELNGKTIHTYIIEEKYASRLEDPSAYASISHDLEAGVSAALALDNNVSGTRFKRQRNGAFKEDQTVMQRPLRLGDGTVIGEGTSVGAGSIIHESIVGRSCRIGKGSNIDSAFVWDNVTIGNDVSIRRAIIAGDVVIEDSCSVGEGALISFGAVISAGTQVPVGARIVAGSASSAANTQSVQAGVGSKAREYQNEDETEDYAPMSFQQVYQNGDFNQSVSSLNSEQSDISPQISKDGSRSQSFATSMSDEDGTDRFLHDTVGILTQRMQEGKDVNDMQSELMGLRFSGSADETQVRKAVAVALVKHIHALHGGGKSAGEASRATLQSYRYLIRRENAEQSTDEQVAFLLDVQADLAHRKDGGKLMPYIVKDLYDLDVLEEDAFTSWYEGRQSQEAGISAMRQAASPFMEWLSTAEDEDSSDEEDE